MRPSFLASLLFVFLLSPMNPAEAQNLSQRAIYERCYAKLVRLTPDANDPYLPQITAGTLTGVQACRNLLNLAKFTAGGQIASFSNTPELNRLARRVLHTMNDVHVSWINKKKFETASNCPTLATNSVSDSLEPALFFTRALFDPAYDISTVVTSSDHLRAIRSVSNPTQSIFDPRIQPQFLTDLPSTVKMTPNGDLLGISKGEPLIAAKLTALSRAPGETATPTLTNREVLANRGGGILGSQSYLSNNFGDASDLYPDLAKMPRTWAKYVFEDLLCRELPVINANDAAPFLVCSGTNCPTTSIQVAAGTMPNVLPFRTDTGCIECHASMDQIAGVVRNFRQYKSGNRCDFTPATGDIVLTAHFLLPMASSLPLDKLWGYLEDSNYRKKPTYGRFLFRTYNNVKRNDELTSLDNLGAVIASTDDFYICAAKRYYRYFTGIDVPILPMTQAQVDALPRDQKFYRQRVVQLGLELKDPTKFNKNPLKLIEAILASPEFQKRDFDLVRQAQ